MLTLITGVPGAGKTLRSITMIEERRLKEGREVYQWGVKGLTYPWKDLALVGSGLGETSKKPLAQCRGESEWMVPDWRAVPDGSIIFIDEAWEWFPVRKQGSTVPDYVESLATHRHRGLDIFMATQGRSQLDIFVRNLVGHHLHLDRKYGMQYSMVYEWNREGDPKSTKDLAVAVANRWAFPKSAFAAYTSATEHTHKARPPWKKIAVAALSCVGCIVLVVFAFRSLRGHSAPEKPPVAKQSANGAIDRSGFGGVDYWLTGRLPRLAGHPESAAIYDPLQKVRSQPRVTGCMQLERNGVIDCRCSGPNHTRIEMLTSQCVKLVRDGIFDETRSYPEPVVQSTARSQSSKEDGSAGTGG